MYVLLHRNCIFFNEYMFWFYSVIFSEGYRHPSSTTVARTVRILHTLLGLVGKHRNCDKFEVNTQSVAYLAGEAKENKPSHYIFTIISVLFLMCVYMPLVALLTVSEEVRSRCSLKHRKSLLLSDVTMENFPVDTYSVYHPEPGCRWDHQPVLTKVFLFTVLVL